jgi:UDP-3-O-[3-hydroxymyristoyl] N-acetylglucosamine deacetylase
MKNPTIYQHTLKEPVSFVGLGLHSGARSRITLKPCDDTTGIFFKRKDVPLHQSLIAARWHKVEDTRLSTGLSNRYGHSVSTVEHLMAAIRLCQIDNLEIEIDGPEVPIMDGSAKPFVDTLLRVGTRPIDEPKKAIWVHKAVEVRDGDGYALLLPDTRQRITVSIDFREKAIGAQTHTVDMNDHRLIQDIAPARTFGIMDQIEGLRSKGLALGGSLNNAILVDNDQIINPEGLRFDDEFVRHKILDAIGDLSLIGVPIIGHFHAFKSGHSLNNMLINKLLINKSAWSYIAIDEFYQLYDNISQYHDDITEREHLMEKCFPRASALSM